MNTVQYKGDNSGRGPSPGLWADMPPDIWHDPNVGYIYFNDYLEPIDTSDASAGTAGIFSQDDTTSGAITNVDVVGGAILFDSDAHAGADDGINAQMLTDNGGEHYKPAAGKTLWFEARVKIKDAATTPDQMYIGLCDRETAIIASGALDSGARNMIGFFQDDGTTAGRIEFVTAKAGSAEEQTDVTSAAAVADDTWVKLGFKVKTEDGQLKITPYVNGVAYTVLTDTDDIPILEMAFSVVAQCEQTSADAEVTVDWVQIAQLA